MMKQTNVSDSEHKHTRGDGVSDPRQKEMLDEYDSAPMGDYAEKVRQWNTEDTHARLPDAEGVCGDPNGATSSYAFCQRCNHFLHDHVQMVYRDNRIEYENGRCRYIDRDGTRCLCEDFVFTAEGMNERAYMHPRKAWRG